MAGPQIETQRGSERAREREREREGDRERARGRKREREREKKREKRRRIRFKHLSKSESKIKQKSTKNRPKRYRKSTKNQSTINQKSILEGSRGVFESSWRPIPKNEGGDPFVGAILGPSWQPLGPSWRPLGPVLAVLAASWARFGLVLAAEIGPQVDQISTQKSIRTLMPLGINFLKDFGGFWEVKWRQVGSKIGAKIDLNSKGRKSTKR